MAGTGGVKGNGKMTGTVVRLKETERYGFIKVAGGGKDRFFHATDLSEDLPFDSLMALHGANKTPVPVAFEDQDGQNGKGPRATNIRLRK